MEIAIDLMTSLRERIAPALRDPRSACETPVFDWHGLHARLAAAHAARAVLAGRESRFLVLEGGFADWDALRASRYASCNVNPNDLADGKPTAAIEGVAAGRPSASGRGQK